MNLNLLNEVIQRYKENLNYLNDDKHDEKFKWHVVQRFQKEWFGDEAEGVPFSEKFHRAIKDSSILINNSTVQPANGVVKLAERAPDEVERLFNEVLFAEDNGDINLRQDHMEEFLDGMEKLLQKYYPSSWKYRQNRHAASCYLSLYAPEKNYIYKYSPVEAFAVYTEFGKDIGSGSTFNLANYYELCDIIVSVLKEQHQDLVDGHASMLKAYGEVLGEAYYEDNSLHLLVFDIIYCADTYGYLVGSKHMTKKEAIRAYNAEKLKKEDEEKRQEEIEKIEQQILNLENQINEYRSISLIGTQVQYNKLGVGTVVQQDINKVRVRFEDVEKQFIISKKYPMRPVFEDDAEIVAVMTDYEVKLKELEGLQKKLMKLRKLQ